MTEKTNMQQFDEIVDQVFGKLHQQFPLPASIESLESKKFNKEIFNATLEWLEDEGYIRSKDHDLVVTKEGMVYLSSLSIIT